MLLQFIDKVLPPTEESLYLMNIFYPKNHFHYQILVDQKVIKIINFLKNDFLVGFILQNFKK